MKHTDVPCVNKDCKYLDSDFEQSCSKASDEFDNPGIETCTDYIPDEAMDWQDQIPWEHLREEIEWVFINYPGGTWRGGGEPIYRNRTRTSNPGYSLNGVKMPQPPTDWRQAIARRPDQIRTG